MGRTGLGPIRTFEESDTEKKKKSSLWKNGSSGTDGLLPPGRTALNGVRSNMYTICTLDIASRTMNQNGVLPRLAVAPPSNPTP